MYSFGSLTSQALEVMTALIQGNFVNWMDTRGNYVGGGFNLYFCGEGGADDETVSRSKKILIPLLKRFSESLSDYRIATADTQYEDSMVGNSRFVIFKLKHAQKEDVVVKITFKRDDHYPSELWGRWKLARDRTVVCLQHSDGGFHKKCVLAGMPDSPAFIREIAIL